MPAKRGNAKLKQNVEQGILGRTDNDLCQTIFPAAIPINQKNFYTEYLKRDDQVWINRQLIEEQKSAKEAGKSTAADGKGEKGKAANGEAAGGDEDSIMEDAAAAAAATTSQHSADDEEKEEKGEEEEEEEEGLAGEKTIVLHMGSRNMRIGLASDAFAKTVPSCIARRKPVRMTTLSLRRPIPKRRKLDTGEMTFGESFDKYRNQITQDFRARMRYYKRRMLPNSSDIVMQFNSTSRPEVIPEHNDTNQAEWTDTSRTPAYFVGEKALWVSDNRYAIRWPIFHGSLNEAEYSTQMELLDDISLIIKETLETELLINCKDFSQYSCVLAIPDLYDKIFVREMMNLLIGDLGFSQVGIIQESVGATFGAGISSACVVDVGAQKISISCVDEGMCLPDSRVNMKFGGDNVTLFYSKVLLRSWFPYQEVDLSNHLDWSLMDDLKARFCTVNDVDMNVRLYHFYKRERGRPTKKYVMKIFDEVAVTPMAYFYPLSFETSKAESRKHRLFGKSVDIYDDGLNNPESQAQTSLLSPQNLQPASIPKPTPRPKEETPVESPVPATKANGETGEGAVEEGSVDTGGEVTKGVGVGAQNQPAQSQLVQIQPAPVQSAPVQSAPVQPAPIQPALLPAEATHQTADSTAMVTEAEDTSKEVTMKDSVTNGAVTRTKDGTHSPREPKVNGTKAAQQTPSTTTNGYNTRPKASSSHSRSDASPVAPLDHAIIRSILEGCKGDDEKIKKMYSNIIIVGNGAVFPGFSHLVEERLRYFRPGSYSVTVLAPPREMEPQMLVWKGAGVFSKLAIASECYIKPKEWDMLGTRCLQYKVLFTY